MLSYFSQQVLLEEKTLTEFSKTLLSDNFESALTVCNFHGFLWERINENTINPQYKDRPRRQDMTPTYQETGSIYATTYKKFLQNNNRVSGNIMPIFVDFEESLEVDTLEEFNVIESYMEKYYKKEWKEVFMKIYCFDIDGTICTISVEDYSMAEPYPERINQINALYDEGNKIIFNTARGFETGIDWSDLTKVN